MGNHNHWNKFLHGFDRIGRKNMNLKIRELKATIENYLRGIDLPPEVKRMVLKEIYQSAEAAANEAIAAEIEERDNVERSAE